MKPSASVVIPTRLRPSYLEVTLGSLAPQVNPDHVEVLVIDDAGPSAATRAICERFGVRYEPHPGPLGLNVARNTGVERSEGELVIFLDDDVEVMAGWLDALLDAAFTQPEVEVFTGPIRARLEGRAPHSCGREGPSITSLDLGPEDTEARYAWGANMAVRRQALERVGAFEVSLINGGDEQEWQDRWRAAGGGPVIYVAGAGVYHRRAGPDARLRALARAAHARGRASRRFDAWRGRSPTLAGEARTLVRCAGHVIRRACPAGIVMVAHSSGRLQQGLGEALRRRAEQPSAAHEHPVGDPHGGHEHLGGGHVSEGSGVGVDDFLSGESGTVGGVDGLQRRALDVLADGLQVISGERLALARAARRAPPRRRVLALGVARPEHSGRWLGSSESSSAPATRSSFT